MKKRSLADDPEIKRMLGEEVEEVIPPIVVEIAAEMAAKSVEEFSSKMIPVYGRWDADDPGKGRTVLLPDGREVFNPTKFAPPIGYKHEPSMMEMMADMLQRRLATLADDLEVDTVSDAADFDIDDPEDHEFLSGFEVRDLVEEVPAVRPAPQEGEVLAPEKEEEAAGARSRAKPRSGREAPLDGAEDAV